MATMSIKLLYITDSINIKYGRRAISLTVTLQAIDEMYCGGYIYSNCLYGNDENGKQLIILNVK